MRVIMNLKYRIFYGVSIVDFIVLVLWVEVDFRGWTCIYKIRRSCYFLGLFGVDLELYLVWIIFKKESDCISISE